MKPGPVGRTQRYAFAHRGGRAHGPDNTVETFAQALRDGARGLETDAWLTADGAVVLDHDGVLRAAKRRHRPIGDVLRRDLPAHIPTLDDLYEQCGSAFDLAVDVRLPDVGDAVIEMARRHDALPRLWLVAASADHLRRWRPLSDDVHLAITLRPVAARRSVLDSAIKSGAQAINMRWMWWTRGRVRRLHADGLLCFAYDAQRRFSMQRCVRLGVDGVFSDSVLLLNTVAAP